MTIKKTIIYGLVILGVIFLLILNAPLPVNLSHDDTVNNTEEQYDESSVSAASSAIKQPKVMETLWYGDELVELSTRVPYMGPDYDGPRNIELIGLLISLDHEDLSKRSDVILTGTVKEVLPSKWNVPDGWENETVRGIDKRIYTDIVISVDQYLKNPLSSDEVIVRVQGGTAGNITMSTDFEPDFIQGEKVLLYLKEDASSLTKDVGPEHFAVRGHIQGKFTLTDDGKAMGWDETVDLDELLDMIETYANDTIELQDDHIESFIIGVNVELVELSHDDLSRESDVILMGDVKEILPSKWNTPDGKRPGDSIEDFDHNDIIYTDVVIGVDEYLKNPLQSQDVIVRVQGGGDGYIIMIVDADPGFKKGERVLLYLREDTYPLTKDIGPEHFKISGVAQGKFTLTDDGYAIGWDETVDLEELLSTIES